MLCIGKVKLPTPPNSIGMQYDKKNMKNNVGKANDVVSSTTKENKHERKMFAKLCMVLKLNNGEKKPI